MRKQVKCKSGMIGWQNRLQSEYFTFGEFFEFDAMYGLAARLGYSSSNEAWEANPLVQGSTIPSDYCRVLEQADLPKHVKVIVELQIDADEPVPEWKLIEGAEQAVSNAIELVEKMGFSHDHADILSIGSVAVSAADNDLEKSNAST